MTRPPSTCLLIAAIAIVGLVACGDSGPPGIVGTPTDVTRDAGPRDTGGRDIAPLEDATDADSESTAEVTANEPPIAVAGDDISSVAGQPIRFDGSESHDRDGAVVAWRWQLGNGVELEGESIDYTYPDPGVFTVTLTVEDDAGASGSDTLTVDLVEDNEAPEALIAGPFEVVLGDEEEWDGRGSDDDVGVVDWRWSTGVPEEPEHAGQVLRYAYPEWEGRPYRLELTVVDTDGVESIDVLEVDVLAPPVGVVTGPSEAFVGDEVEFDATESYDQDDDTLGALQAVQWSFGDGETTGELEFFPIHTRPTHVYAEAGRFDVVASVRDRDEIWRDSPSHKIDVFERPNVPPSPIIDADSFAVDECETVLFTGVLTVDDTDGIDDMDFFWDFGDGASLPGIEVEHEYEREGTYEVVLRVEDSERATGRSSVFVTVSNVAPTAAFDSDPSPGIVDASTNFDAGTSTDACVGAVTRYRWDFGDGVLGTPSSSPVTSHTYDAPGTYEVRLTVEDDGEPALEGTTTGRVTVIDDGGEGVDYSGFFDLDPVVAYSCFSDFVTYGASNLTFIDSGTALTVNGFTRGFLSTESIPLSGEIDDDGTFFATATLPGPCAEDFTVTGAFTDSEHWSGLFEIGFRPAGCAGDCTDQAIEIDGVPR